MSLHHNALQTFIFERFKIYNQFILKRIVVLLANAQTFHFCTAVFLGAILLRGRGFFLGCSTSSGHYEKCSCHISILASNSFRNGFADILHLNLTQKTCPPCIASPLHQVHSSFTPPPPTHHLTCHLPVSPPSPPSSSPSFLIPPFVHVTWRPRASSAPLLFPRRPPPWHNPSPGSRRGIRLPSVRNASKSRLTF